MQSCCGCNYISELLQLTIYRMMDHISQGVTEGIYRTMKDLPRETSRELDVESVAQNLTKELLNTLSVGVPRRIFDALYQSFAELNYKLASRAEINIAPKCHDSGHRFDLEGTSRPTPPVSASAQFLGHNDFYEDPHNNLELSEVQNEGMVDRCCVCFTMASEEELMTTPCCVRDVGSICWEERLQETGKCCLCQVHPLRYTTAPSDGAPDYKVHFITENYQGGTDIKTEVGIDRADSFELERNYSTVSAVADDPSSSPDTLEVWLANANKVTEDLDPSGQSADIETMRTADDRRKRSKYDKAVSLEDLKNFSRDFKLHTPVPEDLVPFISQSTARKQSRELVKDNQLKASGPSVPATTKSQVSANSEGQNP